MVSFQILTTTADMMMTAKMASVAMPISMISGAVGASRASRHVATVLHKAVPEDLLEDVALGDDAREADEEVREADGEGRSSHLSGGQAQARDHREADGHLQTGEDDGPGRLDGGGQRAIGRRTHLFVGTVENERNEDHLGDEGRRGPHEKLGGTGGEAQGEQHAHQDNRLDRVPLNGGRDGLRDDHHGGGHDQKTAQDID